MYKNLIVLPDGTEIFSGSASENAIRSMKLTESVNAGTELTPGSACACMLEGQIITPSGSLNIGAGTEVTLYRVDDSGARSKVGLFALEKPARPSANTYKITAYDRVSRLDKDLTSWLSGLTEWPYTLFDFAGMVCAACDLTLKNTSLPNGDYSIPQFTASQINGRQIMRWIGEICCRFLRATPDGKLEFAWYSRSTNAIGTAGGIFYFSVSYEDYAVAPVQKVQLRLTDDDVGVVYPDTQEELNTYVVSGNYLLTASGSETRTQIAKSIYDSLSGVTYTPCKVSIPMTPSIHAGDILTVTDRNGVTITLYAMKITRSGQRDTIECTGSRSRGSSAAANNEIYAPVAARLLEIAKSMDGLRIRAKDLEGQVTEITQTTQSIILSALEEYATTNDLEQFRQTVAAQLAILSDEVSVTISQVSERVEEVDGARKVIAETMSKYFRFTDTGLIIGLDGNELCLNLDYNIVQFLSSSLPQLWMDERGVHCDEIHVSAIYLGSAASITTDANGIVTGRSVTA